MDINNIKILASGAVEVNALCETINNAATVASNYEPTAEAVFDKSTVHNGITVYHNSDIYVGADFLGPAFDKALKELFPDRKFERALDWCAGAGFIGFSLLGGGLVNSLVLMDAYAPAVAACEKTIAGLDSTAATAVLASSIGELDDQEFDLVVGNPPWFFTKNMMALESLTNDPGRLRKTLDHAGLIHNEFFANIGSRLAPNGVIIIAESMATGAPLLFKEVIEANGLEISKVFTFDFTGTCFLMIEHAK